MNTNCDFVTGHDVVVIQSPPVITKHRGRRRALRTGRMDRGASCPRLGTYREVSDALQDQRGRSRVLPGEGVRAAGDQAGAREVSRPCSRAKKLITTNAAQNIKPTSIIFRWVRLSAL